MGGSNKHSIRQRVNGFTRELVMAPPFDKRSDNPATNYGIHGTDIRFHLIKGKRAVQFVAFLPVYLPHVADEFWHKPKHPDYNPFHGMGADVGYHSPKPIFDGQDPINDCPLIGDPCYYDGSGLRADEWYGNWLREGNDWVWAELEKEWESRFGKGDKENHDD